MNDPSSARFAVSSLDLSRLENMVHLENKITARCPACAADGGDNKGNHLVIFPSGGYGCVRYQGDKEHNRRIKKLVGLNREMDPLEEQLWRRNRAQEQIEKIHKNELIRAAESNRSKIIERYDWDLGSVTLESPQPPFEPAVQTCPRRFLGALFRPGDLLWTGELNDTGQLRHTIQWRTCEEWLNAPQGMRIGPHVAPSVWKQGSFSRSTSNVLSDPYVVLDFDGLDGIQPQTREEKIALVRAGLALTRWLRDALHWQLAAILLTGSKGIHVWFRTPPPIALKSLKDVYLQFGLDHLLIGHPAQPCRLPGHPHPKTGNLSRVIWLRHPELAHH